MARQKNPRVIAVKELRRATALLHDMISRWTTGGRVYLMRSEERTDPRIWDRTRRPEEYPEVQVARWRELAESMRAIERWANSMRYQAEHMASEIIDGNVTMRCGCPAYLPEVHQEGCAWK